MQNEYILLCNRVKKMPFSACMCARVFRIYICASFIVTLLLILSLSHSLSQYRSLNNTKRPSVYKLNVEQLYSFSHYSCQIQCKWEIVFMLGAGISIWREKKEEKNTRSSLWLGCEMGQQNCISSVQFTFSCNIFFFFFFFIFFHSRIQVYSIQAVKPQ